MESDANYIVVCFIHNRVIDLLTVVGELRLWDFLNVLNFALISHETTMCRLCARYTRYFYLFITLATSHRSLDVTVTVRWVHALPAEVKLLLVIRPIFKYTKLSCKVYRTGLPGDSFFRQYTCTAFLRRLLKTILSRRSFHDIISRLLLSVCCDDVTLHLQYIFARPQLKS